jgi:hypothetical protein
MQLQPSHHADDIGAKFAGTVEVHRADERHRRSKIENARFNRLVHALTLAALAGDVLPASCGLSSSAGRLRDCLSNENASEKPGLELRPTPLAFLPLCRRYWNVRRATL